MRSLQVLRALADEAFDTKEWFDLKLEAERLSLTRGFDRLLSLETLPIELYEHQRRAILRVLRDMRGRAVLADEVGLGKTIEAGVILKEYMLRGLVRRVLILVPSSLVVQWRSELNSKLHIPATIARGPAAWRQSPVIVASIDTAKRPQNAAEIHALKWDMLIVDEAHRLKNKATINWQLVDRAQKKYLLLLTATPVQNDLRELYNLVTLLKPGQLKTYAAFKRDFVTDKHSPKNIGRLRQLLDEVMVRTTRRETMIRFPQREVQALSVPLLPNQRLFYRDLLTELRSAYARQTKDERNLLPLILLLREACSSPAAAARTLESMLHRQTLPELPTACKRALIEAARGVASAKAVTTANWLERLNEPAVVFTEFRTSQAELARVLSERGVPVVLFHGGMRPDEKEGAIARFREQAKGVLISTEAGGEGRNLQFVRVVVNYDLPWNPMRIEQRIGRVHRLGQPHSVVVLNLVTEDTIESYLLYLLDKKINLFQQVVGELDVILADMEVDFTRTFGELVLTAQDDEQMRQRVEAFGERLAEACARYQRVRRLNEHLFGGGGAV